MRGVAELKKTTLVDLKNAGKRSNETYPDNDFTWRNFEGCINLKTVIVGKTFKVDARMFHSDGVATASIFTTATSESDFILTIDRIDAGNNNNILSDKVLYKGDTSSCGYWNFDENGNILQASHDFVDGKCTICGEYNTAGVIYGYDTASKTYYVIKATLVRIGTLGITEMLCSAAIPLKTVNALFAMKTKLRA